VDENDVEITHEKETELSRDMERITFTCYQWHF
jgi:hypothetical protein